VAHRAVHGENKLVLRAHEVRQQCHDIAVCLRQQHVCGHRLGLKRRWRRRRRRCQRSLAQRLAAQCEQQRAPAHF